MRLPLLSAAAFATLLAATSAQSGEPNFMADPIYDSPLFNFEGFYTGVQVGGAALPGPGLVGVAGLVAGANFSLSEAFLAGIEFQGEALFHGGGYVGLDALLLGRVGGYVTQEMMAYGAVGGGLVNGGGAYAFGGGLEKPVMDQLSARGEILGTGAWGALPSGAKVTAGLLWHLN